MREYEKIFRERGGKVMGGETVFFDSQLSPLFFCSSHLSLREATPLIPPPFNP